MIDNEGNVIISPLECSKISVIRQISNVDMTKLLNFSREHLARDEKWLSKQYKSTTFDDLVDKSITGKLGELAVVDWMATLGLTIVNAPDFTVWNSRNATAPEDIVIDTKHGLRNISVKTARTAVGIRHHNVPRTRHACTTFTNAEDEWSWLIQLYTIENANAHWHILCKRISHSTISIEWRVSNIDLQHYIYYPLSANQAGRYGIWERTLLQYSSKE